MRALEAEGVQPDAVAKRSVHWALMGGVAASLIDAVSRVPVSRSRIPYISTVGGRALCDGGDIDRDLATNVAHTVR